MPDWDFTVLTGMAYDDNFPRDWGLDIVWWLGAVPMFGVMVPANVKIGVSHVARSSH